MADLAVAAFLALRNHFFDNARQPHPFELRPKRNTQDDPLDEYLAEVVFSKISGVECVKASPLITPDMVLYRPERCQGASAETLEQDIKALLAIEVKKLGRGASGRVARSSGLDYNTTPPCGSVRIYDENDRPLDVRGFYLFVCLEEAPSDASKRGAGAGRFWERSSFSRRWWVS